VIDFVKEDSSPSIVRVMLSSKVDLIGSSIQKEEEFLDRGNLGVLTRDNEQRGCLRAYELSNSSARRVQTHETQHPHATANFDSA
jgi:hypothetical protein